MQAILSPQNISFCKQLHKSELSQKFCFHLPWNVCEAHLSRHDDTTIILVDESGKEYSVKYLVKQNRLEHRGWKEFAIAHGLLVGDILVFHMIDPCKFKVNITRAERSVENKLQNNKPTDFVKRENLIEENGNTVTQMKMEADATDELSNLPSKKGSDKMEAKLKAALDRIEELKKQCDVGMAQFSSVEKLNEKLMDKEKGSKPLKEDDSEEEMVERMLSRIRKRVREEINLKGKTKHVCIRSRSTETNDSDGNSSSNVRDRSNYIHSVAPLGTDNSESALNFKDTESFKNFKIHVNGETLDSKIPADIRNKYYQLCCIQNNFIHDRVMKGLNCKLVVAMILEIVNIADSTKVANISTSHDLECFGKALKSFEDLGMSVGALRAKIGKLIEISSDHQSVEESTRVKLAEIESKRTAFQKKMSKIDELLESAKADEELIGDLEAKANTLKEKKEKLCAMFKEVAGLTQ